MSYHLQFYIYKAYVHGSALQSGYQPEVFLMLHQKKKKIVPLQAGLYLLWKIIHRSYMDFIESWAVVNLQSPGGN